MSDAVRFSRHARVLLDHAGDADAERLGAELETFAGLLRDHPDIARPLLSRGVDPVRKAEAMKAVASQAGFGPLVTALLVRFAERHQLAIVAPLAEAVRARLLERRNVVSAEVTTAVALSEEERQSVARRLSAITGKDVRVTPSVDPSILGGVVAKIGSMVYDGSVTGRLARMRQKLVENV